MSDDVTIIGPVWMKHDKLTDDEWASLFALLDKGAVDEEES